MSFRPHHRRRKSNNYNPLDLQLDEEQGKGQETMMAEDAVTLVDNLQSYDASIREQAAIALTQVNLDNESILEGILEQKIIKVLVERLIDTNYQVALSSLIALVKFCESTQQIDGHDLAFYVYNAGVMTVLDGLFSGLIKSIKADSQNQQSLKIQLSILEYVYKLVASLAEGLEDSFLPALVQSKLTEESTDLFLTVNSDQVLTGVASYWHVLTETSLEVCKKLAGSTELLERAVTLIENKASSNELKGFVTAMLYNILSKLQAAGIQASNNTLLGQKVLDTIFNIISIKIFDEIDNLVQISQYNTLPQAKNGNKSEEIREELGPKEEAQETGEEELKQEDQPVNNVNKGGFSESRLKEAAGIWSDSANGIEVCLGLLVNIFEAADEEDEFEDIEITSDDEGEEQKQQNPQTSTGKKTQSTESKPENAFFEQLIPNEAKEKLIASLIDKCRHIRPEHYEFLSNTNLQSLIDKGNRIVEFALSALMNLCNNYIYAQQAFSNSLNVARFSQELTVFLWEEFKFYLELIYKKTLDTQNNSNVTKTNVEGDLAHEQAQLNEIIKFLLLILGKSDPDIVACIPLKEVLHVVKVLFENVEQQTKLYLIELIAIKASPKNKSSIDENAIVADHLVELLKVEDVMVIGETLNALFDIYVDETYDSIFKVKNFQVLLEYGYNVFKEKINSNKKELTRENLGMLKQHLQNLKRFIKYKKDTVV